MNIYGIAKPTYINKKDFTRLTGQTLEQLANELIEVDGILVLVENVGDYLDNPQLFNWSKKDFNKIMKGWFCVLQFKNVSNNDALKRAQDICSASFIDYVKSL